LGAEVKNVNISAPASPVTAPADHVRQKVQVSMLKKVLEGQQDQARQLMSMTESKGRVVDIRA
jgi:hypothetical protein